MPETLYRVFGQWEIDPDICPDTPNVFYLHGPEKPKRHASWHNQGISWVAKKADGTFSAWTGDSNEPGQWPEPIARLWAKRIKICCHGKFTVHLEKVE